MGEINLSLRGLLGKRKALDYVDKIIYPKLEELVESGKISGPELRKIRDLVRQRGVEVLEPQIRCLDEITINTVEQDAYLIEAALPITQNAEIRNIIKKSSKKEDFKKAVNVQKKLYKNLQGTQFEGIVPSPQFVNKRQRIMVTPYIEGTTLKEALDTASQEQKEQLLKSAIDDYAAFFSHINREEVSKKLNFPGDMQDFYLFFHDNNLDIDPLSPLFSLFRENIADELNEAGKYNIHGDWHPKNVLTNSRCVYLDWANAASNGFPEFDIGKLLTKSDINEALEEKLARYASQKLFENPEDREASARRFAKNQITQELLAVKRYLGRADGKQEDVRKKLEGMANVWHNSALRRIRKAVDEGMLSGAFLEEVVKTAPEAVSEVPDEGFKILKSKYNPNALMSQEAMHPATPLVDLIEEDSEESLKGIGKEISRRRFLQVGKDAAVPLAAAAAMGGSLLIKSEIEKMRESEEVLRDMQAGHLSNYNNHFKSIYSKAMADIITGKTKSSFEAGDPIVIQTAEENGLEPSLLIRIMNVNKVYAGLRTTLSKDNAPTVNILDPVSSKIYEEIDAEENLRKGTARLKQLLGKHDGSVEKALIDFYTPKMEFTTYGPLNEEAFLVTQEARKLAYNALTGVRYFDGMKMAGIVKPPEGFPTYQDIVSGDEGKSIKDIMEKLPGIGPLNIP